MRLFKGHICSAVGCKRVRNTLRSRQGVIGEAEQLRRGVQLILP